MQESEDFGDIFANGYRLGCMFECASCRVGNLSLYSLFFFLIERNEGEEDRHNVRDVHELLLRDQVKSALLLDRIVVELLCQSLHDLSLAS